MLFTCDAVEWEQSLNEDGRVVYKLRVPSKYSAETNLGGVVDYTNFRSPRYKAIRIWPSVLAEWFHTLPAAKDFLIAELAAWEMNK